MLWSIDTRERERKPDGNFPLLFFGLYQLGFKPSRAS